MGRVTSPIRLIMMIESIVLLSSVPLLVFGAILPPPPQYPTASPVQAYNPDIGQTNVGGYGVNKDPYCHKVEKVIFKNKCEPYTEKTCWTNNIEKCTPREFKNCTGVIETNQVQRCFTGKDRVCDTTYDIDTTTKDDYQCCNVETPNCFMEEKTINDVTCTDTVVFDCQREKSTKNDGYGQKQVVCKRTPKKDCYSIPRKIQVEVCKTDIHRYCEKFSNVFPLAIKKQTCHFEPKKICELEMKTRPKKAKKYSYTRIARSNQGRSVTNARRNPSSRCVTCRRD